MARRARVLALLVLLTGLSSCVPGSVTPGGYRIATSPVQGDLELLALAGGDLHGRANGDGTACLWLGDGPHASALYWPYGYSARGAPIAIYEAGGVKVATVGQRVQMSGGHLADDVRSILGCHGFTQFWGVGHVVEATWP
jgi:hypothetical protein